MKVTVKESTVVKPMKETPSDSIWLSNLDLVMPAAYHSRLVSFFRNNGAADFFDTTVLKTALSRALVEFYPYAGRLREDDNGRIEINCNAEGVLFVEAECDGAIDDLGGFTPRPEISSLVPTVDYSKGISTFPLFLVQLTRFKCGGVSLGIASDHHTSDGTAGQHFTKTWSEIARGLTTSATVPPVFDRRILSARDPPQPRFHHVEHQPPPLLKTPIDDPETLFSTFKLTRDQINTLKEKCKDGDSNKNDQINAVKDKCKDDDSNNKDQINAVKEKCEDGDNNNNDQINAVKEKCENGANNSNDQINAVKEKCENGANNSNDQINALMEKCKVDENNTNNNNSKKSNYSTFAVLTGHVWRCVCMARGLADDQESMLTFSLSWRQRLQPPLPPGFWANAISYAAAVVTCGEMKSNPLRFAAGKVHETVERMDNEYLRSVLDNLELHRRNGNPIMRTKNHVRCPNFGITNWIRLPFYESDYGWGKPIYAGPTVANSEGRSYLYSDPEDEGCVMFAVSLHTQHMKLFEKLIYSEI